MVSSLWVPSHIPRSCIWISKTGRVVEFRSWAWLVSSTVSPRSLFSSGHYLREVLFVFYVCVFREVQRSSYSRSDFVLGNVVLRIPVPYRYCISFYLCGYHNSTYFISNTDAVGYLQMGKTHVISQQQAEKLLLSSQNKINLNLNEDEDDDSNKIKNKKLEKKKWKKKRKVLDWLNLFFNDLF